MGHVHAEITLKNALDMGYALDGHIKEEEVRSLTVKALVDTGATRLCISEEMQQKLGLRIVGSKLANMANGTVVKSQLAGPVELTWKERFFTGDAAVVPGLEKPLIGVIPLEGMVAYYLNFRYTVNFQRRKDYEYHGNLRKDFSRKG